MRAGNCKFYVFDRMQRPRRMMYQGAGNQGAARREIRATVIRWSNMPRLRKPSPSSEFQPDRLEFVEVQQAGTRRRSVGDPVTFFRAIAEIERLRGLRVHPESPTRH